MQVRILRRRYSLSLVLIRTTLYDSGLVVQPLDKTEGYFVLRFAKGYDAVPVTFDRLGKLLKGLEPLPFERRLPVVELLSGPGLGLVPPELFELLFENIGGIESLVCHQKRF